MPRVAALGDAQMVGLLEAGGSHNVAIRVPGYRHGSQAVNLRSALTLTLGWS